jgi:hypothetical protein
MYHSGTPGGTRRNAAALERPKPLEGKQTLQFNKYTAKLPGLTTKLHRQPAQISIVPFVLAQVDGMQVDEAHASATIELLTTPAPTATRGRLGGNRWLLLPAMLLAAAAASMRAAPGLALLLLPLLLRGLLPSKAICCCCFHDADSMVDPVGLLSSAAVVAAAELRIAASGSAASIGAALL